jgi:hypothetical protein
MENAARGIPYTLSKTTKKAGDKSGRFGKNSGNFPGTFDLAN